MQGARHGLIYRSRDLLGIILPVVRLRAWTSCAYNVAGLAALWAERQLSHTRIVNIDALDTQLCGHTRQDCLQGVDYLDVGEGLVCAPLD